MSLLSPSEKNAFQSFLSIMDPDETNPASEWVMYNSTENPLLDNGANSGYREALTKATKDLMSLDDDAWGAGPSMMDHHPSISHQAFDMHGRHTGNYEYQLPAREQHVMQHQHQHHQQRHNSFSTNQDSFPFLQNKVQQQHPLPQQHPAHPQQQPQLSPMNSLDHSTQTTPFDFQQRHNSIALTPPHHHQQQQRDISPTSPGRRSSGSGSALSSSRSSRPRLHASTSLPNGSDAPTSSTGVRNGTAGVTGTSKRVRSSTSPSIVNRTGQPQQKLSLLSPSQKKANHIQSEQKRRANIRRGYEALCETVPSLRDAIREEEEQERMANGMRSANGSGTRKKARTKKGAKDGDEQEKDRLDGRAGPRSENVVLSKTIDHIQQLIADRSALLARLHRARSSLPPGHPMLTPLMQDPPWEREWKGGEGRLGDEDPGGSGEEEEEEGE